MVDISKKISNFCLSKQLETFHVDEIIPNDLLSTKHDILFNSIEIYKNLISDFSREKSVSAQINLQIELISEHTSIKGVPLSLSKLIDSIDELAVPEISISVPEKIFWSPKIEIYACPLPFKIVEIPVDIRILYEEYRTLDELHNNDPFYRWLTFSFLIELNK